MADTSAERVRRSRLHKKGDHSLCRRGRCPDATPAAGRPVAKPDAVAAPVYEAAPIANLMAGRIEALAREFVDSLPHPPDDPRHLLGQLAVELARRIDEEGAIPAAVGQLRILLMQLAEVPNGPAGVVDEMRVRHHQRQLDALLALAS